MDPRQKSALRRTRSRMLKDLDVKDVVDHLISEEVLDEDDYERITAAKTRRDRVITLLDLLPAAASGTRTFPSLVSALRPRFGWLADELQQQLQQLSDTRLSDGAQLLEELLRAGAVPSLPKFSIAREQHVTAIREQLVMMSGDDEMLMVHGMAGIGKSVCVNQALRQPSLVVDHFPGGVFWLAIGQLDQDMLIGRVQTLCVRLASVDSDTSAASSLLPATAELAAERLRKLLLQPGRQRCLIVLDDVWNAEVVSVFDLGVPLLLVTRDQSVVDKVQDRVRKVEIQDGFSWSESSQLFATRLGVPADMLPREAEAIHGRCCGSPMVISLLCAYLSEKRGVRESSNRWQYCLNNMKGANYQKLKKKHSYEFANVMDAIGISVKSLDSEVYSSFEDLVVFQADVSIPCKVLCTYWSTDMEDVENRMSELVKKALVQEHWDNERDTMVYGVHDLIIDYMHNCVSEDKKRALHCRLLDCYMAECGDDFGRLPNDNYLLWYVGHHVYHSGRHQLFAQLYFSLPFVGAKVRATGASDLLSDYRKYAEFLDDHALDGSESHRRRDFESFVRTAGHRAQVVPSDPFVDPSGAIIQLALCQPDESTVYRAALVEAEKRAAQHLFLRWSNKESMRWSNVLCTKVFSSAVSHVTFTDHSDLALTSYGDGNIKLWNVVSGDEHYSFRGHRDRVNWLSVSGDGSRLLSASDDQQLKVWDLAAAVHRAQECSAVRTPSPKLRQSSGLFSYNTLGSVDCSLVSLLGHTGAVLCCDWSSDGGLIASAGADRCVKVWDSLGEQLLSMAAAHDDVIMCCQFAPDCSFVATGGADSQVKLWSCERGPASISSSPVPTPRLLHVFSKHQLRVVGVWVSPDSKTLVSVADREIYRWSWSGSTSGGEFEVIQIRSRRDCDLYLCASVAPVTGSGHWLVAGTSNNMYETWDLTDKRISALQRGFTSAVCCVSVSRCGGRLLAGAGDTVSACCVGDTPRVEDSLLPLFSAVFTSHNAESLVVAAITSNSGVQGALDGSLTILNGLGGDVISSTSSVGEKICVVELNSTGTLVAFGCEDGSVGVYQVGAREGMVGGEFGEARVLGKHSQRVISLQFGPDNTVISGAEDNTMKVWWADGSCTTCGGNGGAVTQVGMYQCNSGTVAVSCSRDGTLKVFVVQTGSAARLISAHRTHSGATVTCYRIIRSRLERISSPPATARAPPSVAPAGSQRPSSPCPPDLMAVTAAVDGSVRISRLVDGVEVKSFWLDHGPVRSFQLSDDQSLLVTGHDDGHLLLTRTDADGHPLVLSHHQSWVTDIIISPDCSYVVSLADNLAWWKLYVEDSSSPGRLRLKSLVQPTAPDSPRLRTPRRQFIKYRPTLTATGGGRGGGSRPGIRARLLQTFAFRGSSGRRLVIDPRWTHAVTIDDAGVLYVLQVM